MPSSCPSWVWRHFLRESNLHARLSAALYLMRMGSTTIQNLHLLLYDYHMLGYCVCTHLGERTAREWDLLMTTEPEPAFHPTRSVSLTPTSTLVLLLLITRSPDSTFVRTFNPQGQAKIYILDHLYKHHYSPTLRSVATAKHYRI